MRELTQRVSDGSIKRFKNDFKKSDPEIYEQIDEEEDHQRAPQNEYFSMH